MSVGGEFNPDNVTTDNWRQLCDDVDIRYSALRKHIIQLSDSIIKSDVYNNPSNEIQKSIVKIINSRLNTIV